ncbi:MAG: Trp biosynthesis-associated membrane protein [Actinomycetota bacterium]|nr:Trp biosynthesis-associated membrane protein [Actinomycetota bacterium]MDP2288972.1 Trp biosynthesis-associated membrane protein [Actinomycetota bacterium]
MRSRRLALTLLIVGSLGVLGSCALQWVSASVSILSGIGTRSFTATGSQLLPQATAWAVLALAGSLAYIALRSWVRQIVGLIVAVTGVVLAVLAVGFGLNPVVDSAGELLVDIQVRPWWVLVALCALLILASGVMGMLWSRPWPALGSRFEAEGVRRQRPTSPWDALDAGQDPTMSDPDATQSPA